MVISKALRVDHLRMKERYVFMDRLSEAMSPRQSIVTSNETPYGICPKVAKPISISSKPIHSETQTHS